METNNNEKIGNKEFEMISSFIISSRTFIEVTDFETKQELIDFIFYKINYTKGYIFAKLTDNKISGSEFMKLNIILREQINLLNFKDKLNEFNL